MKGGLLFGVAAIAVACACIPPRRVCLAADPASPPLLLPASPAEAYKQIVDDYLDGKWEQLASDLDPAVNRELSKLSATEAADVAYIHQTAAECRPGWWDECKLDRKVTIRPELWNRVFTITYDPDAKPGVHINTVNNLLSSLTTTWIADDMDSATPGEHGFSKGELASLGIWSNLETADIVASIPPAKIAALNEDAQLAFQRYCDFRGALTAAYYGTPRARRWAFWMGLYMYAAQNAEDRTIMPKKALGAMFIAEVLTHRRAYPSITLPDDLPAENAETSLAQHLMTWIETHPWTLAEDRSLRQAVKVFAAANGPVVYETGKVTLPSGLPVYLDPTSDKEIRAKRDAWVKNQFDHPPK